MPPSDTDDRANPYARRGTWGRAAGEIPTVTPTTLRRAAPRPTPPVRPEGLLVSPLKPSGNDPGFLTARPLAAPGPAPAQPRAAQSAPSGFLTVPAPRADDLARPAPAARPAQPWPQPVRPAAEAAPPAPAPAPVSPAPVPPEPPAASVEPAPGFAATPVFAEAPRAPRRAGLPPWAILVGGGVAAIAATLAAFLLLGRANGPPQAPASDTPRTDPTPAASAPAPSPSTSPAA
ncbi:MAG: hypothetical protein IT546_02220, partial [Caulobacteraceae bacterium]|nr:hypothetical protein [Caulobacteraceae bacterium]